MRNFNREALLEQLAQGCEELNIALPENRQKALIEYLYLLVKWNQAMNLTSVRDPGSMVVRHLLDSLSVLPYVSGRYVLDVGTGAGLPGIPLAVASPEQYFTLLDSLGKRTHFLMQVVAQLGLKNVDVVHCRLENYNARHDFDVVVSRAFSSIYKFTSEAVAYCGKGGKLLAMKGCFPDEEMNALAGGCKVLAVHALKVPGLAAERHVVEIGCSQSTATKT